MREGFVLGNAFDHLSEISASCVDLFFTSMPDLSEIGCSVPAEYFDFLSRALVEAGRITKPSGFMVFVQTDRRYKGEILLKHNFIINHLKGSGWKVKDYKIIVKGKRNPFILDYSHLIVFTKKGTVPNHKRQGIWFGDVWEYKPVGNNYFNPEFSDRVVEALTEEGNYVVDPFAGRGTVCASCQKLNRKYFGIELDKATYDQGMSNLESASSNPLPLLIKRKVGIHSESG